MNRPSRKQLTLQQLTGTNHVIEALRANTHEFLNKLHVISGLLQIGETQQAVEFINGVSTDVEDNYQSIIRLIQQIVAERKGYLDIESEPGEGSSFTVNFSKKRERKSVC